MPNQYSLPEFNIVSNHFNDIQPTKKEDETPIKIISNPKGIALTFIAVNKPAPIITGIDNKKENLAASGADKPIRRPIQMVIPDLEIPGIIAPACANPIINATNIVNFRFLIMINLEVIKIIPVIIYDKETNLISSKINDIISFKTIPTITAGIVPQTNA